MKHNKSFHPRNKHIQGYDFQKLCFSTPELKKFLTKSPQGTDTINFARPEAVRALNKALLKSEYNIENWTIPDEQLCPPIPSRVDYIHHIADLIGHKQDVRLLDIGTGANGIYALIAAGLSLIFGLMEIVNFAHGEHLMLSMFSSFWLWSLFGIDPIFSIPITILLMALCGIATHYFLIRYILKAKMLIQICATFGLSIFIRSIAQLLWTPDFRNIEKPILEGRLEIASVFIGQPQLIASIVCLIAFIGLYLFVTKTETGLALQATAQDRHAAEILGIPSNKMFAIGWAIGLGCVGVAGGMMSNYFFIFTDVGINFALFAFVAVALGGFGSIIGCLYAGIIIGLVESLGGLLIDPSFKLLYVFAIYLLVVIYRPQGLFGRY